MHCIRWNTFLAFGFMVACGASAPPPAAKQAASDAAVQRARAAGAADVPEAVTHLQYAEEEIENARALVKQGENRAAGQVFERARFEAEVATAAARANRKPAIGGGPPPVLPAQAPVENDGPLPDTPAPVESVGQTQQPIEQPIEKAEETAPAARRDPAEEKATRAESEKKGREALEKIAIMGVGSVRLDDRGTVISMPASKLFVGDTAAIAPVARDNLQLVADAVKSDSNKIVVEGYTDSQGNAASNKQLGQRRADAIRDVLVARGVPADRVRAEGRGGVRPIADNGTVVGRAKNHRVEILVQAVADK
jgi:outer membrane protein OmpA-like peptidoglycan-associated protein